MYSSGLERFTETMEEPVKIEAGPITEHETGDIWLKLLTDLPHPQLDKAGRALKKGLDEVEGYTVPESADFDRWEADNPVQWILMVRLKEKVDPEDLAKRAQATIEEALAADKEEKKA